MGGYRVFSKPELPGEGKKAETVGIEDRIELPAHQEPVELPADGESTGARGSKRQSVEIRVGGRRSMEMLDAGGE